MDDCVFCKIIKGDIPSKRYYEDDDMIIIADINPKAKLHYLAIPKTHYTYFSQMTAEEAATLGKCIKKVGELAPSLGLSNGFRFIVNQGEDGEQTVPHVHMHLLGGQKLTSHSHKADD